MKNKNDGKRANNKRPYIRPRATVLNPESDQAKELAEALAGAQPVNDKEKVTRLKSPKARKRKLPRSA